MTKKQICMIGIFAVCFMLTGCCMNHEWKEPTCTEPKTCAKCGKTEGEAIGHTWVEATCAEAKHCSVCGETEGVPLEHALTEANYQQPATCKVCGETVGEPLTPDFVKRNVKGQFMELSKTYDYVTVCNQDSNFKTIGQATITDYQTFTSDDTHEAKEGYEWKTVTVQLIFSDKNAQEYGASIGHLFEDYNDIIGHDDSMVYEENGVTFTTNWNGQKYTECKTLFSDEGGWKDNVLTVERTYEWLIPIGYDGAVVGVRDYSIPWEQGMYIFDVANDDTLFFRLD